MIYLSDRIYINISSRLYWSKEIFLKSMLPVKKWMIICCPVFGVLFGNLLNLISEGLDSGTESLGWLMLYLVCALTLTDKKR